MSIKISKFENNSINSTMKSGVFCPKNLPRSVFRALPLIALSLVTLVAFMPDSIAATSTDLKAELDRAEKLINGGYIRLGLFGLCGIAGGIAIVKQNIMGLIVAGIGAVFVYMMKSWINTNFAALI